MRKTRALTKYRRNLPAKKSNVNWVIIIGLIALVVWLIIRNKSPAIATQYKNTETWDIEWTEDGLPKKVIIHRDAEKS